MIYSRWRPDTGGFEYFENAERRGLGDDLPIQRRGFSLSPIGTSSVSIGRLPNGRTRKVGEGELARGMVMPASKDGLNGLPLMDRLGPLVIATVAFFAGMFVSRWHTKRGG